MDINTLIDTIVTAVSTDSTITSWASTTYSQAHQVFENVDRRDPPGEEACPFVIIYPSGKSAGQSQDKKHHHVEVDVCIYDETKTVSGNVTSYAGTSRLETFRKYVENAVVGADVGNALVDDLDVEYDTVDSFPFMWAGMIFTIGEDVLIGADPLE
ncbi:hypothetical protein [Desulfosarcina ovata]|uniref:Uncharacterized protein n=1 Tax=Desulfosarcina ovata subsp. ovata TaxID=2752305 RepID=A0A5K8AH85_9BACT|nr:hypothetical protein [Desulfosarcina ovata]BBO92053.1 hypothetical protein DSCOOX_52330 [Desulfosarcina ovata subsp. ovata]